MLDLGRVLAAPICTQMLGDLGAEVIKVEPPEGDATRGYQPPDIGGESAAFLSYNRNKRGVVLDLAQQEGREVARELALRRGRSVERDAQLARDAYPYRTFGLVNAHEFLRRGRPLGDTEHFVDEVDFGRLHQTPGVARVPGGAVGPGTVVPTPRGCSAPFPGARLDACPETRYSATAPSAARDK